MGWAPAATNTGLGYHGQKAIPICEPLVCNKTSLFTPDPSAVMLWMALHWRCWLLSVMLACAMQSRALDRLTPGQALADPAAGATGHRGRCARPGPIAGRGRCKAVGTRLEERGSRESCPNRNRTAQRPWRANRCQPSCTGTFEQCLQWLFHSYRKHRD